MSKVVDFPHDERLRFRCGVAARWLPRALAAAVLVAAMLGAFRIDARIARGPWGYVRHAVILAGALAGLAILRKGAELRTVVGLDSEALVFRHGSRQSTLRLADIESLEYAPPFSASRSWVPATVLVDRFGSGWRLAAFLQGGDRLIAELLQRTERNDLRSWAEVLRLARRMGRAGQAVTIGYAVAALLLIAAVMFYLTGPAAGP